MNIQKTDIKQVEKLADSVVNALADQEHIRKIMKRVFLAAYDTGFSEGIEAAKENIKTYIEAE